MFTIIKFYKATLIANQRKSTMKKSFIFIAATFLFLTVFAPLSLGASRLNASIKFNQLVYESSDEMNVQVKIKPKTNISDVRIVLKIGEKDDYVFSQTHFLGNLKKDNEQKVEFSKNRAKSFGLKFGKNPIIIDVTEKQKTIYRFSTDLGLKETVHENKMGLALAISVADKPRLDIDKNITDRAIHGQVLPVLEKYIALANKQQRLISYIFSPILAESISIISGDYTLIEKSGPVAVPAKSHSSIRAKRIKDSFTKLFKSKKARLISTSYTQALADELSPADADDQMKEGKKILNKTFSSTGFASYPPNGIFYKGQPAKINGLWLARNKAMNIYYLKTTRPLLKGKSKQAATMRALAYLTESYNNGNNEIVLVTADLARPDNIAHFLNATRKQKWLDLKPLHSLKPKTNKKRTIKDNPKRKVSALIKARRDYVLLNESIASENSAFNQAKMAIYLAEDKNTNKKRAEELASKARGLLKNELDNIILKLSPLTLTGSQGKLPVRIINNTNSKHKLFLEIETNEFGLETKKKTIELGPKENLVSIPVKVLKSGRHKVLVRLRTDSGIITEKYLTVSTSLPTSFWYYFAAVFVILLLIIVGAFYAREKRSRTSS